MALSLLATEQELAGVTTVAEARAFAGLSDATWQALSTRLGGANSLRLLAMQPISTLQTAMQATRLQPAQDGQAPPPERELTSVECTQLALMFRVALQKFALPDANPLAVAQAAPAAAVAPPTTSSTPLKKDISSDSESSESSSESSGDKERRELEELVRLAGGEEVERMRC